MKTKAFPTPPHSRQCFVTVWTTLYQQKTTNMPILNGGEWEGCGLFCSLKLPHLLPHWLYVSNHMGVGPTTTFFRQKALNYIASQYFCFHKPSSVKLCTESLSCKPLLHGRWDKLMSQKKHCSWRLRFFATKCFPGYRHITVFDNDHLHLQSIQK